MISAEEARLNTMKKIQEDEELKRNLIVNITNSILAYVERTEVIDFISKSGEEHFAISFTGQETCLLVWEMTVDNKRRTIIKTIEIKSLPRKRRSEVIETLAEKFKENKYCVVPTGRKKDSCVISW